MDGDAGFKMYGDDLLGDENRAKLAEDGESVLSGTAQTDRKIPYCRWCSREGGGGEYPLQDGFGWTNGVVRRLIGLYGEPYFTASR
ncbi:trehalase family glycosidase [Escherichia coli]